MASTSGWSLSSGRQVVAGVELIAPGALVALDGAIQLRPFGWQHEQSEAFRLTGDLDRTLTSQQA